MYVILSQKIDTVSSYGDELFKLYHYPSRYKNLLNTGDIFITKAIVKIKTIDITLVLVP